MNKKQIKEMTELVDKTESFLMDYANGRYGKCGENIDITKEIVEQFMEKASKDDMEEILCYTTPEIMKDFLSDLGTENEGASDLEDYIKYVINFDPKDVF